MLINVVKLSEQICGYTIRAHLKYATEKNFVGRPIAGYEPGFTDIALLTPNAAADLCRAQNLLNKDHGLGLLIYDAYRPKRAVYDFMLWSRLPPANNFELERKAKHYPHIEKNQLFDLGYIMEDSNHCYGNTVDVVLVDIKTGEALDMGARFDFMDELSHLDADRASIGEQAFKHRQILQSAMIEYGFEPYHEEFWHFSHGGKAGREVDEPMDIEICKKLKDD